uniref:Uncharacterized protein n=1 Tax=Macaca fascicularis TaxID=9541 RepID=A0A7N9ICM8_MACFA
MRSGVRDQQPGQHTKALSLQKYKKLARITGAHHHTWLIFVLLVETGFRHLGQAGLGLLTSSDLLALVSQTVGITGVSHRTWPVLFSITLTSY